LDYTIGKLIVFRFKVHCINNKAFGQLEVSVE